jgi:hypothetical protein
MKKLNLKTEDFIVLSELTGLDIQNSPAATLEFVKAAEVAKDLPLKPAEVKFMLRHEPAFSPFNNQLNDVDQKLILKEILSKLNVLSTDEVTQFLDFIYLNCIG